MNTKTTLTNGNRAVVIVNQDGYVFANLFVNVRNGIEHADITGLCWSGATVAGAARWAAKQLAA